MSIADTMHNTASTCKHVYFNSNESFVIDLTNTPRRFVTEKEAKSKLRKSNVEELYIYCCVQ